MGKADACLRLAWVLSHGGPLGGGAAERGPPSGGGGAGRRSAGGLGRHPRRLCGDGRAWTPAGRSRDHGAGCQAPCTGAPGTRNGAPGTRSGVRPEGTRRLYAVESAPLREVDAWLGRFRRFWAPHLEALATELARGGRERRLSGQGGTTKEMTTP